MERTGKVRWARWSPLAGLALLPLLGAWAPRVTEHLFLEAEYPKADTTITSPAMIVLYFSQEPLPDRTQIHLFDAAGKELKVGPVHGDSLDPFTYATNLPDKLPPGLYQVGWQTWSDDEPEGFFRDGGWKFTVIADGKRR